MHGYFKKFYSLIIQGFREGCLDLWNSGGPAQTRGIELEDSENGGGGNVKGWEEAETWHDLIPWI